MVGKFTQFQNFIDTNKKKSFKDGIPCHSLFSVSHFNTKKEVILNLFNNKLSRTLISIGGIQTDEYSQRTLLYTYIYIYLDFAIF